MNARHLNLLCGMAHGLGYLGRNRELDELVQNLLARLTTTGDFVLTERGRVFVQHLEAQPLPLSEVKWIMPTK